VRRLSAGHDRGAGRRHVGQRCARRGRVCRALPGARSATAGPVRHAVARADLGSMDFFIALFSDPVGFWNSHSLLISQIGINSMIATSMFLVLYSGQLSLAAPGFMAIGAYTSVLMDLNWHTPLVLNIAVG